MPSSLGGSLDDAESGLGIFVSRAAMDSLLLFLVVVMMDDDEETLTGSERE